MTALERVTFLPSDLGDVVGALSRHHGKSAAHAPKPPPDLLVPAAVQRWMEGAATAVGLEAEPLSISFSELDRVLREAECLLIPRGKGFLVLLSGGASRIDLLGPGLRSVRYSRRALARELRRERSLELFGSGTLGALPELLDIPAGDTERLERAVAELAAEAEIGPGSSCSAPGCPAASRSRSRSGSCKRR
jgi:hypothetical protein